MAKPQKHGKKEEKKVEKKAEQSYKDWTALKSGVQRKQSWFVGQYVTGWFAWSLAMMVEGPYRRESTAKEVADERM